MIVPRLAAGAAIPIPRKLKNASVKIACGIRKIKFTVIGPAALGRRCLVRILMEGIPSIFAARAKSVPFRRRISPRTIRAMSIHPATQSPRMILGAPAPRTSVIRIT